MKKPFLHALYAALYIVIIVSIMFLVGSVMADKEETLLIPMTMLSLFVLSAAIMGYLFLYEPLRLLLENKKQEAITFFGKTVGFFACFVILFGIVVLVFSGPKKSPVSNAKIDVKVACESALTYTTFLNAEDADKFVAECIDGKHPDVIDRYIESLGVDDAVI